ncbi:MAG: RNA polymerase sigma-54 factor [Ignavibacteria bacterium CG_4_8_14_3_um_filter_37_9]|nr:RNA polymerase factor sigma-54 [Ignavibacteria bacterium]OIO13668.1 MAG: RNA polymerase sigma-54 factor [Ignavibacteria bacterium CG1_02_37_35]PIP77409.1 MAG: RNA polymerase sigma-54 factor [Ignavibacteria bacterium CG22_combo_CG10-13_8_21_14_all_37_15]PIX00085.1 MAG: RNA polymerase sigma-54 factor [Ignavibacteria bacterium CG_4_8_14_3_um_filter_37_9]PIX92922.1 MAG: RNA polymerase sigma-54 factor [Ignavibacteria bacterium CG_4_10_14_3_um_filter_37_18]PJC57269.1 MAG: RNA polymerase sigma-54 
MLSLSQRLSQTQKLSPQQIQYQKLLQLNTMALEQRIKTELELNPILEEDLELKQEEKDPDEVAEEPEDSDYSEEDEFTVEDYMNDEDYFDDPSYSNTQKDQETFHPTAPQRESLQEHLLEQLYLLQLAEPLVLLGEEIIGSLDQDGYLKQDLEIIVNNLDVFDHLKISLEDAENVLKEIQLLDPIGIASRSLQECLIVQIQNGTFDPYYSYLAEEMLKNHFEDFVQKRFDSTMQKMSLTQETLRAVLDLIQKLNPKPGEGNFEIAELNQITPDFLLEKVDNNYIITLNDRAMPSVTVNAAYIEMLNANKGRKKISEREKNTYKFLREKFESAKWFIACIEQRRETLLKVMRAILEKQVAFFEKGPKFLRPMIYKDIAEEIMMDISTISRVVNGKFVQSMQGVHELKYFFSEGLATDSGEEVSNKHIKERIKEIIIKEDKQSPLSDDKIAEILNEEGIHIARRTVAKYREQLRLPVARLRKTL